MHRLHEDQTRFISNPLSAPLANSVAGLCIFPHFFNRSRLNSIEFEDIASDSLQNVGIDSSLGINNKTFQLFPFGGRNIDEAVLSNEFLENRSKLRISGVSSHTKTDKSCCESDENRLAHRSRCLTSQRPISLFSFDSHICIFSPLFKLIFDSFSNFSIITDSVEICSNKTVFL